MRCRLCLTELPQGQIVCPICGLDNSSYYQEELKKEAENKEISSNNNQNIQTQQEVPAQEPIVADTIQNQEQVNVETNQSVVTNHIAEPIPTETNTVSPITESVNQPVMTETVSNEKIQQPQEQIAATPIQTNTETISTSTVGENVITPVPEINEPVSNPLPNTASNQTTTQAPNMMVPNNQSVTNPNVTEQEPIQKKTNSMIFHNVFMFLTGFSILILLITAFLFHFDSNTLVPVAYSGVMLFGLITRANYGRILAMIQGVMTAIAGIIVTIIGFFAAPLILGMVQLLDISFIPASIFCILGVIILIYGICIFVYYKKRKVLFH